MAADVSTLLRVMNGYYCKDDQTVIMNESGKSTGPITRDLLGGSSISSKLDDSQELDLDLQVPNGWEKRLDLKSGKVYIQRCNSPNSPPSSQFSDLKNQTNQTLEKFQDLNVLPSPLLPSLSLSSSSSKKLALNLFEETSLDLKLVPSSPVPSSSSLYNYQSVCTLDKVKFALERAEKNFTNRKRSSLSQSSSPSNSSSSTRVTHQEEHEEVEYGGERFSSLSSQSGQLFAAGCPNCLLYVMISKSNPKCPRCNSTIPLPVMKKPRIDLNMSI